MPAGLWRTPALRRQALALLAAVLLPLCAAPTASAGSADPHSAPGPAPARCIQDASWVAPQPPVHIHGNTWHVGPRGLGVFLITADTGHVLIDGGVRGHERLIEANIRALGLRLRDVRWMLVSHAHCDHAGGVARLARDSGAQVIASTADAAALASGGKDDPHYGNRFLYPPVTVTRPVRDGETLQLGSLSLTAHATPGHTRGNTSWTWSSCEQERCLQLAFVGSLSAPDYRLVGNAGHPGIVQDYEESFRRVAALPCDIALAPHPGMVDFWERAEKRGQGQANALVDPGLCRAYASEAREAFGQALARQRAMGRAARP